MRGKRKGNDIERQNAMTPQKETARLSRMEASQEFQEFIEKVKQHNLRAVLTSEALMPAFLMLGAKMWERGE